jgi:hypothetical protein
MFELGKLFSRKPDHPMNSVGKARDLLSAVDESDPVAALVEIGTWANSLAGADGFACDDRFLIISEIEAAGSRVALAVFQEYLRHIHKRDQEQRRIFESLHGYWAALAEAYERCVHRPRSRAGGRGRIRQAPRAGHRARDPRLRTRRAHAADALHRLGRGSVARALPPVCLCRDSGSSTRCRSRCMNAKCVRPSVPSCCAWQA